MKFKVKKDDVKDESILYLLVLEIDGKEVYKIGITSRKIEDRVCEILTSHFGIYRHFPYCRPKRFRKVSNTYEHEQELLKFFEEYKYEPYSKFSGSTELISDIDLDFVVEVYESVINDEKLPDSDYKNCDVCGKKKKFKYKDTAVCGTKCEIKEEDDSSTEE